jgi:hypothetical protein
MLGSLDGDGRVQVARRGHIDEVDVLAGDDLLPVGGVLLEAVFVGGVAHARLVAPADDL